MACLQTQLYALVNPVADSIAELAMQKDFMLLSCNHHNHIEITCQVQLFCIQNTLSSSCDRCLKKKAERQAHHFFVIFCTFFAALLKKMPNVVVVEEMLVSYMQKNTDVLGPFLCGEAGARGGSGRAVCGGGKGACRCVDSARRNLPALAKFAISIGNSSHGFCCV